MLKVKGKMTKRKIAIVGGGITGSAACRRLSKCPNIIIDLFDQGRRGVGGRTSSRRYDINESATLRFDHGCQFFRADTDRFKKLVHEWIDKGYVSEWNGDFRSSIKQDHEFFGLPSTPPFYVAVDGPLRAGDGRNQGAGSAVTGHLCSRCTARPVVILAPSELVASSF